MEEKKKRRWNIVDVVVIVVVVLVGAFFAWKTTRKTIVTMPVNNMGTIRFVIEVDGLRKDMYDSTAAMLPCQMAASGKLVEGFILDSWANPVTLVTMKSKSPVNASMEQTLEPEEGVEYVNAYYVCEAAVDLNDNLNLTGTQEIRLGRSYYLKSVDFEYSGTIISLEKFEEQFAVKYREQLEE